MVFRPIHSVQVRGVQGKPNTPRPPIHCQSIDIVATLGQRLTRLAILEGPGYGPERLLIGKLHTLNDGLEGRVDCIQQRRLDADVYIVVRAALLAKLINSYGLCIWTCSYLK